MTMSFAIQSASHPDCAGRSAIQAEEGYSLDAESEESIP